MPRPIFQVGEPVPDFTCRSSVNERFAFSSIAGRYVVLFFIGSIASDESAEVLRFAIEELQGYPHSDFAAFFAISVHPEDERTATASGLAGRMPFFWDFDCKISIAFGATDAERSSNASSIMLQRFTLVLDPSLRVLFRIPLVRADTHNTALLERLLDLPPPALHSGQALAAPVLIVPRVFGPGLCKELIDLYVRSGGQDSGFMQEQGGQTIGVIDHRFKRRHDLFFDRQAELEPLRQNIRNRIKTCLVPEILKSFQFKVTRIERFVVACYEGGRLGFFGPHRDNTTKGTAHRRFACTLNLNVDEYEGGDLRFPEFCQQAYRAPTGGAVIFSCSLLHEATQVTRGTRYAFLPFLYDEAAAELRQKNLGFVGAPANG